MRSRSKIFRLLQPRRIVFGSGKVVQKPLGQLLHQDSDEDRDKTIKLVWDVSFYPLNQEGDDAKALVQLQPGVHPSRLHGDHDAPHQGRGLCHAAQLPAHLA